jgi:hypothetical protein
MLTFDLGCSRLLPAAVFGSGMPVSELAVGEILLISQCLNSECGRPLQYLRGGRIVRTEYRVGIPTKLEHFWLCGDCSQYFDFCVFVDRPAVAIRREENGQRFVRTEEAAFLSSRQAAEGEQQLINGDDATVSMGNPVPCLPGKEPLYPNKSLHGFVSQTARLSIPSRY